MGMPPTKLYSLPPVCKATTGLLAIHDDLQGENIPIEVSALTVRSLNRPCLASIIATCFQRQRLLPEDHRSTVRVACGLEYST